MRQSPAVGAFDGARTPHIYLEQPMRSGGWRRLRPLITPRRNRRDTHR
jgi:hypothetical protein